MVLHRRRKDQDDVASDRNYHASRFSSLWYSFRHATISFRRCCTIMFPGPRRQACTDVSPRSAYEENRDGQTCKCIHYGMEGRNGTTIVRNNCE